MCISWHKVYRQNALQRLLLTLTVTFVSFYDFFTVYFSSMYSRCDLSTGIYYTNIWIWIYYYISVSYRKDYGCVQNAMKTANLENALTRTTAVHAMNACQSHQTEIPLHASQTEPAKVKYIICRRYCPCRLISAVVVESSEKVKYACW